MSMKRSYHSLTMVTSFFVLSYIESDLSKHPHRNRYIEISPSEQVYREIGGTKAWGKSMLFPRKER